MATKPPTSYPCSTLPFPGLFRHCRSPRQPAAQRCGAAWGKATESVGFLGSTRVQNQSMGKKMEKVQGGFCGLSGRRAHPRWKSWSTNLIRMGIINDLDHVVKTVILILIKDYKSYQLSLSVPICLSCDYTSDYRCIYNIYLYILAHHGTAYQRICAIDISVSRWSQVFGKTNG